MVCCFACLYIIITRLTKCRPFIINNILFIVLELGTGFCQNYSQFLACRALFGIAMGGLYGNAAATALKTVRKPRVVSSQEFYNKAMLSVIFWRPPLREDLSTPLPMDGALFTGSALALLS